MIQHYEAWELHQDDVVILFADHEQAMKDQHKTLDKVCADAEKEIRGWYHRGIELERQIAVLTAENERLKEAIDGIKNDRYDPVSILDRCTKALKQTEPGGEK